MWYLKSVRSFRIFEKISKIGTQPIVGTQINFKIKDTIGLLPVFALNEIGYRRIIELSSISYLQNETLLEPHVNFDELLKKWWCINFFRHYFWFIR